MLNFRSIVRLACAICLLSITGTWAATTVGYIYNNETWGPGNVTLTGDVICTTGTVTILPGTTVKFATTNSAVRYGDANHIWLTATVNGNIIAEGTAQSPITFTSTALSPQLGAWGRIEFLAAKNTASFKYCNFSYAQVGIEWRWDPKIDVSTVAYNGHAIIDHCSFSNFLNSGMYATAGVQLDISNSTFYNLHSCGIFIHGGNVTNITNCSIRHCATGINNAGWGNNANAGYPNQAMTLNHVTIYDIDGSLVAATQYWTGFGVFCANYPSTGSSITIRNSIITHCTQYLYAKNQWTNVASEDYNCWYNDIGAGALNTGTPSAHDVLDDPMFNNAAAGDFSLDGASLCKGTASDGLDMGYIQGGIIGIDDNVVAQASPAIMVALSPNPIVNKAEFTVSTPGLKNLQLAIYTLQGALVKDLSGSIQANKVIWDGTDQTGLKVRPGIYLCAVNSSQGSLNERIVVTR
jgi:hypothetical protein